MYWYFEVLKKYAVFNGRARRKEFWWFFLINFLIGCVLEISGVAYPESDGPAIISGLYQLATFLPMLGVYIRRFHDTGRSGWWVCIPLVPLVLAPLVCVPLVLEEKFDTGLAVFLIGGIGGMLVLMLISFIFLCQDSKPGANQYGPNPKEGVYGGMGDRRKYQVPQQTMNTKLSIIKQRCDVIGSLLRYGGHIVHYRVSLGINESITYFGIQPCLKSK